MTREQYVNLDARWLLALSETTIMEDTLSPKQLARMRGIAANIQKMDERLARANEKHDIMERKQ